MKNFIQDVINNVATIEDIENYVLKWHTDEEIDCSLRDFLGMTKKEYENWMVSGDEKTLKRIIENHRDKA